MRRTFTPVAAALLLCLAGPAGATFPGKNGRLAFAGTDLQPAQLGAVTIAGAQEALGVGDDPVPSPDGTKIAFAVGDYPDEALWISNADGSERTKTPCEGSPSWAPDSRRLACVDGLAVVVLDTSTGTTTKVAEGYAPLWSPEGSWIAYLDGNVDSLSIVQPNAAGNTEVSDGDAYDAAWAPDGTKLVFTSREGEFCAGDEGEPHSIWVVSIPNGAPAELQTDDNTRIYDPAFSLDSTRVSYVENFGGPERCTSEPLPPDRVYVARADGSARLRLPCEGDAAWSPDSARLACVTGSSLRVVSAGGGTAQEVGRGVSPTWSPDGSLIAFAGRGVDVVRPDGSGERTLVSAPDTFFSNIQWLRDSAALVYSSRAGGLDREIFTSNPDGNGVRKLTANDTEEYDPAWSPNGKRLAYVHEVVTKDTEDADNAELYVMNADGSRKVRLTRHAGFDWQPSWSPDGRHIVFVRAYGKDGHLDLAVLDVRTRRVRRLAKTYYDEWWPAWSPNGRWIAFVRGDGGAGTLRLIRPSGHGGTRIAGGALNPSWSPTSSRIAYADEDGIPRIARVHPRRVDAVAHDPLHEPTWSSDGRFLAGDGGVLFDVRNGTFSTIDGLKPYDPQQFDWQRVR